MCTTSNQKVYGSQPCPLVQAHDDCFHIVFVGENKFLPLFVPACAAQGGGDHGSEGGPAGVGGGGTTSRTKSRDEELLNVRDVVELLRDFLRAKALTESEISREVGRRFFIVSCGVRVGGWVGVACGWGLLLLCCRGGTG